MISLDNLFDEENRDVLAKLEAESGRLLKQMGEENFGKSGLQNIIKQKELQSPFMSRFGQESGVNSVEGTPTSIFPNTGEDEQGRPTYRYLVRTIPCKDGAIVYSQYLFSRPEPHQMFLFYENEDVKKSNLFGSFYIASIGDSFRGIINNFLQSPDYSIPTTDSKIIIKDYDTLTKYVNSSAFSFHGSKLEYNTTFNAIQREYNSKAPEGLIYGTLCSIDEMVAGGLNWCADKLENFLLTEASYIPAQNYKPVVKQTPSSNKQIHLETKPFDDNADSELGKDVNAALNSAYDSIADALSKIGKAILDHLPEPLKKIIKKMQQVVQWLKEGITAIVEGIQLFLTKFAEVIDEILKLLNAFLCGIINGIIGTVQAILRVLAFLIDMSGMDSDYQGYLRRRDVGEKVESVLDFITESFTSLMGAIKDLFTQSGDATVDDIKNFLQSVGGLLQKGEEAVVDFWNNTSRYKFAYWAGIFVFEVLINVLLLIFTGGAGNVARAGTYIEKFAAWAKLLGREAISVATFGVVDILAFFRSSITAFVKACGKGLKGFFRWVEELIKGIKNGKAKNGEELLKDAEKGIFRRIVYSGGKRGEALLTLAEKEDILKYAKSYGIHENDIVFFDELAEQRSGYALFFGQQDRLVINTDIMPGILNTANSRMSWKAAIAHELEGHRAAALVEKTFFDPQLDKNANDLLEEIQSSVRASRYGKELSNIERQDLLEDGIERFNNYKKYLSGTKYENYTFNEITEILWLSKN